MMSQSSLPPSDTDNNDKNGDGNTKTTQDKIRVADFSHPLIKKSDQPDCLSYDTEGEENVLMPCDHSFSPTCLFQYIKTEFNDGKIPVKCPQCKKEWSFSVIQCATGMSVDEGIEYHSLLEKWTADETVKQCPRCNMGWIKQGGEDKVHCPNSQCDSVDLCFECLMPWHSSYRCGDYEERNQCLQNSKLVRINDSPISSPQIRACPRCQTLIEYKDRCNHMTCLCKHQFCFICLQNWINPQGQEVHAIRTCTVAPIQQLPLLLMS